MSNQDKSAGSPPQESLSAFEKLAAEIARRAIFEDAIHLAHNSVLYKVEKDWKIFIIINGPEVDQVETLSEFERAVRDPGISIIYIPASAMISMEGIRRVCERNAVSKTILKEVLND